MALEGFTGWHGSGKTYNAVSHVLGEWDRRGHPIWSNAIIRGYVPAADVLAGNVDAPIVHFETWDDLMGLIDLAVARRLRVQLLIDEAGKFLSSRFYNKLDPRVLMILQERRKIGAGLDLYWTAPHIDHVDKILRDVTQVVHVARRFGGSEYSHDGGRPPRAFWLKTYRPNEVTKERRKALSRRLVPFRAELAALYTTGIVSMATPMAKELAARADYRGPEDRPNDQPEMVPLGVPREAAGARRRGHRS